MSCTTSGAHTATVSRRPDDLHARPGRRLRRRRQLHRDGRRRARSPTRTRSTRRTTMAANIAFGFTVDDICADPFTPIPSIQGTGLAAAITGTVTTRASSSATSRATARPPGLLPPGCRGRRRRRDLRRHLRLHRAAPTPSAAGDVVRVTGFARERFNQTTLNGCEQQHRGRATQHRRLRRRARVARDRRDACRLPLPTSPERYEGMLVRFPQSLVISEYFDYDRFGELVLALPLRRRDPAVHADGDRRARRPGARPRRSPTACAASRSTTASARRTRSVLRHPERRVRSR